MEANLLVKGNNIVINKDRNCVLIETSGVRHHELNHDTLASCHLLIVRLSFGFILRHLSRTASTIVNGVTLPWMQPIVVHKTCVIYMGNQRLYLIVKEKAREISDRIMNSYNKKYPQECCKNCQKIRLPMLELIGDTVNPRKRQRCVQDSSDSHVQEIAKRMRS